MVRRGLLFVGLTTATGPTPYGWSPHWAGRSPERGDDTRRLHLAEKTVRNHVSTLLIKVGAPDRAALVAARRRTRVRLTAAAGADRSS